MAKLIDSAAVELVASELASQRSRYPTPWRSLGRAEGVLAGVYLLLSASFIDQNMTKARSAAINLAAACIRFVVDCCPDIPTEGGS